MNDANDLTLYRQGEDIKDTLGKLAEALSVLSALPVLAQSAQAQEEYLTNLNTSLNSIALSQDNAADKTIETGSFVESVNNRITALEETSIQTLAAVKGIQVTVDTFVGWFVPILDDFRESAILPTMRRIEGKVETLTDSHEKIKSMAGDAFDKIEPTLNSLTDSPLIRMLGVK